MVDAGCSLTVASALERPRLMAPLGIAWLEEPLSQDDLKGYAELCGQSPAPIAAGEGEATRWGFEDPIERGLHAIQPDVAICGGLTVARQASCADGDLVEYCLRPSPLKRKLVRNLPLESGRVPVPQAPGLGIELDEDVIAEFRV